METILKSKIEKNKENLVQITTRNGKHSKNKDVKLGDFLYSASMNIISILNES